VRKFPALGEACKRERTGGSRRTRGSLLLDGVEGGGPLLKGSMTSAACAESVWRIASRAVAQPIFALGWTVTRRPTDKCEPRIQLLNCAFIFLGRARARGLASLGPFSSCAPPHSPHRPSHPRPPAAGRQSPAARKIDGSARAGERRERLNLSLSISVYLRLSPSISVYLRLSDPLLPASPFSFAIKRLFMRTLNGDRRRRQGRDRLDLNSRRLWAFALFALSYFPWQEGRVEPR
jgi:hypothetical protein